VLRISDTFWLSHPLHTPLVTGLLVCHPTYRHEHTPGSGDNSRSLCRTPEPRAPPSDADPSQARAGCRLHGPFSWTEVKPTGGEEETCTWQSLSDSRSLNVDDHPLQGDAHPQSKLGTKQQISQRAPGVI